MAARGHSRHWSLLPLKGDIRQRKRHGSFVVARPPGVNVALAKITPTK